MGTFFPAIGLKKEYTESSGGGGVNTQWCPLRAGEAYVGSGDVFFPGEVGSRRMVERGVCRIARRGSSINGSVEARARRGCDEFMVFEEQSFKVCLTKGCEREGGGQAETSFSLSSANRLGLTLSTSSPPPLLFLPPSLFISAFFPPRLSIRVH